MANPMQPAPSDRPKNEPPDRRPPPTPPVVPPIPPAKHPNEGKPSSLPPKVPTDKRGGETLLAMEGARPETVDPGSEPPAGGRKASGRAVDPSRANPTSDPAKAPAAPTPVGRTKDPDDCCTIDPDDSLTTDGNAHTHKS